MYDSSTNQIVALRYNTSRTQVKKFAVLQASSRNENGSLLFFYCRYTKIINSCIVWTEVIRIVQAGCGLYVALDTKKSKTCLHSSMT